MENIYTLFKEKYNSLTSGFISSLVKPKTEEELEMEEKLEEERLLK